MEVKLIDCPFCGSKNIDESMVRGYAAGDRTQPIIAAGCWGCGATGPQIPVPDHSTGYKEAADSWNKRPQSDLEMVQKALNKTDGKLGCSNSYSEVIDPFGKVLFDDCHES